MVMSLFITRKRNTVRGTKIWDTNWLSLHSNIYISVRKFLIRMIVFMVAWKRTLLQVGCFSRRELFYLRVPSVTRLHSVDGAWIKHEQGLLVERNWQRKTCVYGENYVHVSPSQQISCELLWNGNRTSAARGQQLIAWTMLVVMRPGREADDSEWMQLNFHLHVPMVWSWIRQDENFAGNFYRYRLGVVKRLKDLLLNEMHIIYYFLVSSLNCKPSLNSPDWWRLSWFRLCFF